MRCIMRYLSIACVALAMSGCSKKEERAEVPEIKTRERWTEQQANEWYTQWGWLRGSNFTPSTAINQLEMWQAETFDTTTINRELGWAESIGLNAMRVYLHHLAWKVDSAGFKNRVSEYLAIADKHKIGTIFVFFDDCWNPTYTAGKQPDPKPGVHNSGWVRDPGDILNSDTTVIVTLEKYVKDVMNSFRDDKRIILWDLYNEPGNNNLRNKSMPLLEKVFAWGREVNPSQPLSAGVWTYDLKDLNAYQLKMSDVITYHNYEDEKKHQVSIDTLKKLNRPMICTEYMARRNGSRFENIMPMLKDQNIGAINWGLVSGKTNTIYAWDTPIPDGKEPPLWFHDIFRKDGSVFNKEEVAVIKKLSGTP
jgi:hypothetical protein